jgi:hypothetical protein
MMIGGIESPSVIDQCNIAFHCKKNVTKISLATREKAAGM